MSDEDFSTLPVTQRLTHTTWKARLHAYEELFNTFEALPTDAALEVMKPDTCRKMLTDSNVVAQESALKAFCAYLQTGSDSGAVSRLKNAGVVGAIVEKGLASSRAKSKEYAVEALLLLVEISNEPDEIIEELLPYLKNRLPKLVAGVTTALYSVVDQFGIGIVSPKPILSPLAKLFAHADKNVRAEATKLAVALHTRMGDALETVLFPELKPVQQKDLKKAFENNNDEGGQKRLTRRQQEQQQQQQQQQQQNVDNSSHIKEDVEMAEAPSDPYAFVDPVDVLGALPSDFDARLGSSKWKDRKEVLEETAALLEKTPKMAHGDYSNLVRALAKCMKDANVQVVQLAAECTSHVVRGIGKEFARYQGLILGPIMERTKEKKASVAGALAGALDSIFSVSSLADVLEDVLAGMRHKTPQVKIAATSYLQRCLAATRVPPIRSEVDAIVEIGVRLLGESLEPVRQAATEMIGTLMKIVGERELASHLDKVDDNRKAKVRAFYDTVEVRCKNIKQIPTRVTLQKRKNIGETKSANSTVSKSATPSKSGTATKSGRTSVPEPRGLAYTDRPSMDARPADRSSEPFSSIPAKRGATSPAKREDSSKVSSFGRGLTGRSLTENLRPLRPEEEPAPAPVPAPVMSNAELEELQELRARKAEFLERETVVSRLKEENTRISQELAQHKAQAEYIKKDHTNALLMVKQKETQIARLTTDIESAKLKIRDLEQTIEMMKLQSRPPTFSYERAELSSRVRGLSIEGERDEDSNVDSWKRAAEVTSQLKARIEKMKARSRQT